MKKPTEEFSKKFFIGYLIFFICFGTFANIRYNNYLKNQKLNHKKVKTIQIQKLKQSCICNCNKLTNNCKCSCNYVK